MSSILIVANVVLLHPIVDHRRYHHNWVVVDLWHLIYPIPQWLRTRKIVIFGTQHHHFRYLLAHSIQELSSCYNPIFISVLTHC